MLKSFKIIAILCLISSLARFVLDSYLPSLPGISQAFGISDATTQWTLTLYLLGFSFSQLIYGPLSDHYGRKPVILTGLGIFFVGNLACSFANSSLLLLFARFVAGVGAGSCGVLNRAIASDCFKGAEFSKIWSHTTTTLVITLCVAPVLGGYIQQFLGWRANFMLSTLFVGLVLALIIKFLPETNHKMTQRVIDQTALNVNEVLNNYKIIFTTPSFLTSAFCYMLAFSGLIAYFQVSPLLFMDGLQLSPSQYGWSSLVIAGNYLIGGFIVNKFACRVGTQWLLVCGSLLLIVGGVLMWVFMGNKHIAAILLPAAIYVIGARIVIPNAIAGSMEKLRHLNGSSSALIGFIQMLGSSLISFVISNFDNTSTLPLAIFLTCIGCVTLCLSLLIIKSQLVSIIDKIKITANWLVMESVAICQLIEFNIRYLCQIVMIIFWMSLYSILLVCCRRNAKLFCLTKKMEEICRCVNCQYHSIKPIKLEVFNEE